jgi:hypothetical protein
MGQLQVSAQMMVQLDASPQLNSWLQSPSSHSMQQGMPAGQGDSGPQLPSAVQLM